MENWKFALSSIMGHKMRSFLTMLGIIIGVAAVIVIMALGDGMREKVSLQITQDKDNIQLIFLPDDQDNSSLLTEAPPAPPKIQVSWLEKLNEIEGVDTYFVTNSASGKFEYNGKHADFVDVKGADSNYFKVKKLKMLAGRAFTSHDYSQFARIMLIDKKLADNLFSSEQEALNKIVTINDHAYRVIGVYENSETSNFGMGSMDGSALMTNMQVAAEFGANEVDQVEIHVNDVSRLNEIGKMASQKLTLLSGVKEGKFDIIDLTVIQDQINTVVSSMTMVIGTIAGISLLVGGIGVMNIMLVSVTERTREIGLRKALGATRSKIMTQFLIESVVLTVIGGLIGLLFAYGISQLIGAMFSDYVTPIISITVVIASVLFSAFIGIIFGLLPANKASKLNPIEALRYE